MNDPVAGQKFGPFTIIGQLGRGGMATVLRAYEPALDRYVALKVLHLSDDPAFLSRFEREARVVARLEHPHIVPVFSYGVDDRRPWMAMRWIRGGSLAALIRAQQPSRESLMRVLGDVASALDYAHAQGVIHRDVKPQNILIEDEDVFLADFGISKLSEGAATVTSAGAILGTPEYMAPEQAQGNPVGPSSDIYSLGIVAYEALTGQVPFSADTPVAVLLKHVGGAVPVPPAGSLPLEATAVLVRCLAKDPAARWDSATEFVDALSKSLSVVPLTSKDVPNPKEGAHVTSPTGVPWQNDGLQKDGTPLLQNHGTPPPRLA